MSTGKRLFIIFCALALAVPLTYLLATYHRHQEANRLRHALGTIQLAVERYAVDHEGSYPQSLDLLQPEGYLDRLPDSPYGGSVRLLKPGEPARPGGVLYLPIGPVIYKGDIDAGNDGSPTVPTEIDQYTLIIYQKQSGAERGLPGWVCREMYNGSAQNGVPWKQVNANIDRRRIAAVLTAGEDSTGEW